MKPVPFETPIPYLLLRSLLIDRPEDRVRAELIHRVLTQEDIKAI